LFRNPDCESLSSQLQYLLPNKSCPFYTRNNEPGRVTCAQGQASWRDFACLAAWREIKISPAIKQVSRKARQGRQDWQISLHRELPSQKAFLPFPCPLVEKLDQSNPADWPDQQTC
jgi:hypothetical protein